MTSSKEIDMNIEDPCSSGPEDVSSYGDECYVDKNLDWSFVILRPHIEKIVKDDYNTLKKKSVRNESRNPKRLSAGFSKISQQQQNLRAHLSLHHSNLELALENYDSWNFDIFNFGALTGQHVMLPLARHIFTSHGLLYKFHISGVVFDQFLLKIERHYRRNPFHNATHATDVMQTVNSIMVHSGFIMAKLYIVSILENHHLRVALGILRIYNVLASLTEAEYAQFKDLLCSMILSTDMANHFNLITNMKMISRAPTKCHSRARIHRIMMLLLHAADISNPAKPWEIHKIWVSLFCQECFDQGDKEKKLKLPISPNCDKLTVNIAAFQIGFMQTFCRDTFQVLYTLMEQDILDAGGTLVTDYPWLECMDENMNKWNMSWSTRKCVFLDDLLTTTAQSRNELIGLGRKKKKRRRMRHFCCCFLQRDSHLFNMSDLSSTTGF